jgi:hypothetical protein
MSSGNTTPICPQIQTAAPSPAFRGAAVQQEPSSPLLRSALHRLAQPLMASLCISEFLGHGSGGDLERTLGDELQRAVAVFLFLQEMLEARRSSHAAVPVCLAELLRAKLGTLDAVGVPEVAGRVVQLPDTLMCQGNRKALDRTLDFLFEVLGGAVRPGGTLEIATRSCDQGIELRMAVVSDRGEELAARLHSDARPFDSKSFDFRNRKLPEVALVQTSLEAFGGDLRIEGSDAALAFSLFLRHVHSEPVCCI